MGYLEYPPHPNLRDSVRCFWSIEDATAMGQTPQPGNAVELGFEVEDVGAMQQRLGERAAVQQMGWGEAIETADPDGNKLNLYRFV